MAGAIAFDNLKVFDPKFSHFEIVKGEELLWPDVPKPPIEVPEGILKFLYRPETPKTLVPNQQYLYSESSKERGAYFAEARNTQEFIALHDKAETRPLLANKRLWVDLAQTDASSAGITSFASRYGFLLKPSLSFGLFPEHAQCTHIRHISSGNVGHTGEAESLDVWMWVIPFFREFLDLLVATKMNDQPSLSRRIRWRDGSLSFFRSSGHEDIHLRIDEKEAEGKGVKPEDHSAAAYYYLREKLSRSKAGGGCEFSLVGPVKKSQIVFEPISLLAGLFLQAAEALDATSNFVRCDCSKLIEVRAPDTRSSRRFCSETCRVNSFRLRKQNVRKLYKEGMSAKQLADQFSTDTDTIEFWISGARKKPGHKSLKGGKEA